MDLALARTILFAQLLLMLFIVGSMVVGSFDALTFFVAVISAGLLVILLYAIRTPKPSRIGTAAILEFALVAFLALAGLDGAMLTTFAVIIVLSCFVSAAVLLLAWQRRI